MKKEESAKKSAPLLDRYIQRTLTDKMQRIEDELLAGAIKTLLHEDKKQQKHLN